MRLLFGLLFLLAGLGGLFIVLVCWRIWTNRGKRAGVDDTLQSREQIGVVLRRDGKVIKSQFD